MTRVNSTEHVLLLLRERLQRMERGRSARTGKAARSGNRPEAPVARLQAMAGLDQLPQDELRRSLVRALLSEELGEGIANDPGFAAIAEEVYRMISDSDEGRALIERASQELTGPR